MKAKIGYVELPAEGTAGVSGMKQFYGRVMGWEFQDWGREYAAFDGAGVAGGFNGGGGPDQSKAPLVIVETDDLEAMEAEVQAAGGTITVPIFSFPGGRRIHFTDPAGNELAAMQPE